MKTSDSGIMFLAIGIGMNVIGRVIASFLENHLTFFSAGALFFLMFASVVIAIFGIYRIIKGLIKKS
jgi:hypothetical protein